MHIIQKIIFVAGLLLASLSKANTVLITGGMHGLGKEIAKAYKNEGWNVWVTSRYPEKYLDTIPGVQCLKLDLTDEASIRNAVQMVMAKDGHIDVLVNNAGYGVIGPEETISLTQAKAQFDANFFGPLRLIQEVLPSMREKRQGHIINISSTSGLRALPGLGIYAASKFALEAISESLAALMHPWNIKVTIIEPGAIANDWASHCEKGDRMQEQFPYELLTQNLQQLLIDKSKTGQPMVEIAQLIVNVSKNPKPDFRYQTNTQAKEVAELSRKDSKGNESIAKMQQLSNKLYRQISALA